MAVVGKRAQCGLAAVADYLRATIIECWRSCLDYTSYTWRYLRAHGRVARRDRGMSEALSRVTSCTRALSTVQP